MDLDAQTLFFDCSNHIEPFKCKRCPNFETNFVASLIYHIEGGHQDEKEEEKIYECSRCSMVTFSKYLHVRHSLLGKCAMTHGDREDRTRFSLKEECVELVQESCKDTDPCTSGLSISSRIESIETSHIELSQFGFGPWHCDQCPFKCKYKSILRKHIAHSHPKPPNNIQWFACAECASKFKRRTDLNRHTTSCHTNPDDIHWFSCDQCPYKSKRKEHLKPHIENCHSKPEDIRFIKCDHCGSRYKNRSTWRKHKCRSKPEEIQSLKCDHCPVLFASKGDLKTHQTNAHLKPKTQWFYCTQCTSEFTTKRSMQAHVARIHSKPKEVHWFQCDQCSHKFKRKSDLDKHTKARHALRILGTLTPVVFVMQNPN